MSDASVEQSGDFDNLGTAGEAPEVEHPALTRLTEFARKVKMQWVENDKRGDIPPVVLVEKGDEVVTVAIAPDVDKHQGLHMALVLRKGFDPDRICIVLDSHFALPEPGDGPEEMQKKYPPGSMQKACDEEGACSAGKISDCLVCAYCDRDGKISMRVLPYDYHGKDGPPFKWTTEGPFADAASHAYQEDKEGCYTQGLIPDTLRDIMTKEKPLMQEKAVTLNPYGDDFSEERKEFHTGRAVIMFLRSLGCQVEDLWSKKHPEWTE
jgi:hypothetical protein